MNLYLLTTGLGDFYLVAETPNDAQNRLEKLLDRADYGFRHSREVKNIKLLARELEEFPKGRPNFSSDHTLILPNTCEL